MNRLLFRTISLLMAGALILSACSAFGPSTPSGQTDLLQVTQTMAAVATNVQQTLAAVPSATPLPTNTPAPTNPPATATTAPTAAPSTATPEAAAPTAAVTTPISSGTPTARITTATNCRSGPSTSYPIIFTAEAGTDLTILNKSSLSDYVVVQGPSGTSCWLWTKYANISGNVSGLPEASIPALPTVAADFTFDFFRIESCAGFTPGFKINDNGSTIWQSYTLVLKDLTTKVTQTISADAFDKRSGCDSIKSIELLDPGDNGFAYSDSFSVDPTGHPMKATLTLCSHNGLGGSCMTQTLTFTP